MLSTIMNYVICDSNTCLFYLTTSQGSKLGGAWSSELPCILLGLSKNFCRGPKDVQVNLDMTDSMGPGKLVRHTQNPSYTYDKYLICIRLGPSILSVICKDPSYSGPSYPSSPVLISILNTFTYFEDAIGLPEKKRISSPANISCILEKTFKPASLFIEVIT